MRGQGEGPIEARVYFLYFVDSVALLGQHNGR